MVGMRMEKPSFRTRQRRGRDALISISCLSGRNSHGQAYSGAAATPEGRLMEEARMEEPSFRTRLCRGRDALISISCLSSRSSQGQAYGGGEDGEACYMGWTRVDVPAANGEAAVVRSTWSWNSCRC
ncbi:hypothetical protein MRX96_045865 [Rhipicephalus microplus]